MHFGLWQTQIERVPICARGELHHYDGLACAVSTGARSTANPGWRTIARMKTLVESNPFLRSAKARKKGRYISVKTSSAIEGIRAPFADNKPLRRHKDVQAFITYWKRRSAR